MVRKNNEMAAVGRARRGGQGVLQRGRTHERGGQRSFVYKGRGGVGRWHVADEVAARRE